MADLVAAEFHDQDRCQFHVFLGRFDFREISVEHLVVLRRTTSSSTTRSGPRVCDTVTLLRSVEFCSTVIPIKSSQHVVSDAARKGCHVIYVRVRDHGCHGGVDVSCFEFVADVFRKKCDIVVVWTDRAPDQFRVREWARLSTRLSKAG